MSDDVDHLTRDLLDASAPPLRRAEAARALWKRRAGREALLAAPDVDVEVTVAVLDDFEFDEAWFFAEPLFDAQRFRDAWTFSRHAGAPALLDRLLSLVDGDPFGAMCLLGESRDPRAALEVQVIFERCGPAQAEPLYSGLATPHVSPHVRRTARAYTWHFASRLPVPSHRRPMALSALRTLRARGIGDVDAIVAAQRRLQRSPSAS